MSALFRLISKHKTAIAIVAAILLAASIAGVVCSFGAGIYDSDIMQFIGKQTDTREGLAFLNANFGVNGDIMLVVEGENDDPFISNAMSDIYLYKGVSELIWYGTLEEVGEVYGQLTALLRLLGIDDIGLYDDSGLSDYLKRPAANGRFNYVVLILTEYSPSSQQGFELLDSIEARLSPNANASSGMTATARQLLRGATAEVPFYLLAAFAFIIVIILLSADSYLEPLVILAPIVLAILLNAGTNFIFGKVSVISLAASTVLQLTITTDFALIINSIYKGKAFAPKQSPAIRAVAAGGTVTALAFCSLFVMRFGLGGEIARLAIKGILFSLLSAVAVVPLMYALLGKWISKTQYKTRLLPVSAKPSKYIVKYRFVIIALTAITVAVSFWGLRDIQYSYFKIFQQKSASSTIEKTADELQNQLILAVPVMAAGDGGHSGFIAEIEGLQSVDKALGAFSSLKADGGLVETLLNNISLDEYPHITSMFRKMQDGRWFTLYSIVIKGSAESPQALQDYVQIKQICDKYFAESYRFGLMAGASDIKATTPKDFTNIMLILGGIILLGSMLLLLDVKCGLAVAVITLAAVIINIAIQASIYKDTNFIVYLIMGVVQAGSTLNYGMLAAVEYKRSKRYGVNNGTAAANAINKSLGIMTVSLCIIILCSLGIFLITDNLIIKDIVKMLARGSVIGCLLMAVALPSVLALQIKTQKGAIKTQKGAIKR